MELDVFSEGLAVFSEGLAVFFPGLCVFFPGLRVFFPGLAVFLLGLAVFSEGLAVFFAGLAVFSAGLAVFSAGLGVFSAELDCVAGSDFFFVSLEGSCVGVDNCCAIFLGQSLVFIGCHLLRSRGVLGFGASHLRVRELGHRGLHSLNLRSLLLQDMEVAHRQDWWSLYSRSDRHARSCYRLVA